MEGPRMYLWCHIRSDVTSKLIKMDKHKIRSSWYDFGRLGWRQVRAKVGLWFWRMGFMRENPVPVEGTKMVGWLDGEVGWLQALERVNSFGTYPHLSITPGTLLLLNSYFNYLLFCDYSGIWLGGFLLGWPVLIHMAVLSYKVDWRLGSAGTDEMVGPFSLHGLLFSRRLNCAIMGAVL